MGDGRDCVSFIVGDTVIVQGVRECVFGYNEIMEDFIGQEVHITRAGMDKRMGEPSYLISEDGETWLWDGSCFEYVEYDDFVPMSEDELKGFILNESFI